MLLNGGGGATGSAPTLAAAAVGLGGSAGGGGSSSSSSVLGTDSSIPKGDLPQLFLFIGILSGRGYRHRRLAVREAWSNRAQMPGQVVARFILSEDERTPQVEKELEAYGDIVFVREKTNYKSILYKTYYVMEYAATHYNATFVLKTDDDAFINVSPLLEQLRALCENPGCASERLYMGKMAKHSEVLLQPGHKWNNAAFHNHTGLKEYPNYMMGGGYVVGGEVARLLVDIHSRMRLKFTPIEDATLGFWLMAMDLRHLDHPRFHTWAAPCCFKAPARRPGERFVTRFQLAPEFEAGLCSADPWLVLHKIDSPTKMRYVGARVANCSAPPRPWALAPSILPHLTEERRSQLVQRWQAEHPGQELVLEPPQADAAADGGAADTSVAANGKVTTAAAADGSAATAATGGATTAAAAAADSGAAALGDASTSSTATMRGGGLAAAAATDSANQASAGSQAGSSSGSVAGGAAAGLGAADSSGSFLVAAHSGGAGSSAGSAGGGDAGLQGGTAASEAGSGALGTAGADALGASAAGAAASSNPAAAAQSAGKQDVAAAGQGQSAVASSSEAALGAVVDLAGSAASLTQAANAGSAATAGQAAAAGVDSAVYATQAAASGSNTGADGSLSSASALAA